MVIGGLSVTTVIGAAELSKRKKFYLLTLFSKNNFVISIFLCTFATSKDK